MGKMIMEKPELNSIWMHHSGRLYRVLFIANDVEDSKPDYPITVIYEGQNGKKWAGRLDDWYRRMTLCEAAEFVLREGGL
jgi:hypothetical protein